MKKFGFLAILFIGLITLSACGARILEDEDHEYYAMGEFSEWTPAEGNLMEAIANNDDRVSSLSSELSDATYLYVLEITLTDDEGWSNTFTVDGVEVEFNGGQAVKAMRLDPEEDIQVWMPSRESGEVHNLTPDTLFMPNYVDPEGADFEEGLGDWNSDPFAFEPGTYILVYARIGNQNHIGLIPVE